MLTDAHGELRCVVVNGESSRVLEDAQVATGQGPCIDAVVGDEVVTCPSLAADGRWPTLSCALQGSAVESVLTVPLRLSGTPVGSLNITCATQHLWSNAEHDALLRVRAGHRGDARRRGQRRAG